MLVTRSADGQLHSRAMAPASHKGLVFQFIANTDSELPTSSGWRQSREASSCGDLLGLTRRFHVAKLNLTLSDNARRQV